MVSDNDAMQPIPKRKGIGFYIYCLLMLGLFVGNFLTWREVGPAKRELRKTQRFLDQQLNANRLRDAEVSARGTTMQRIGSFRANGMHRELTDALKTLDEELLYVAETDTDSLSLFSTDDNQSLVIELSLYNAMKSADDPDPKLVEVPLSENTMHQLQLGGKDGEFAVRLDDKAVLTQTLAKFCKFKPSNPASARLVMSPGILVDELNDYANTYKHQRWKTLLVRTYAYPSTNPAQSSSQFVSLTISVKSKGDLFVPQRFHASAARTVNMAWDPEKAHYKITGVVEQ